MPRLRQLLKERLSAAQDQRLDQEAVFVDEVRRRESTGEPSTAPDDDVRAGLGLDVGDLGCQVAPRDRVTGQLASSSVSVWEKTILGMSFIGPAYGSSDPGQYDDISW